MEASAEPSRTPEFHKTPARIAGVQRRRGKHTQRQSHHSASPNVRGCPRDAANEGNSANDSNVCLKNVMLLRQCGIHAERPAYTARCHSAYRTFQPNRTSCINSVVGCADCFVKCIALKFNHRTVLECTRLLLQ